MRTVAVRTEGKHIIHYELKIENYLEKVRTTITSLPHAVQIVTRRRILITTLQGNITSRVLNVISILGWEPDSQFDVKVR